MATYKKRGAKKSVTSSKENEIAVESTTAEVFEALDSSASKTEEWVVKYQNIILTLIGVVAVGVFHNFCNKIPNPASEYFDSFLWKQM